MRRNSILFLLCIIAFSSFIFAENTYYVDSSNGNDSNNGLSPESAWKTIGHVNNNWWQFMPGDNLLFKRGTIYTDDSLWLKKGGTSSNYMVIGAYASGKNPVLKNAQGGIICGEANIGYIQIQDLMIQDTQGTSNGITFNRDGVSKIILSRLEISNCGNNGIFLSTIDTYTIEECSISNCGNAGIVIYGSSTYPIKNGIIRNNNIHYIKSNDGITLHRDDNGKDIGPSHQIINNVLYDCAEQGLDITSGYHIVARGNETHSNMVGGIAIGWEVNDVWIDKHYSHDEKKMGIIVEKSSNVKITSSIIFNAAYHSLTINECNNFEAYNNTIAYGPDSKGSILDISPGSQNISFKNNIFTCTQSSNPGCYVRYLQGTTPQNTNSQFDHNIWWQVSGSDYGLFYDESRGRYSFSGWRSYYNQDANGQFIDPQLENQESRNFHLQASSPGIDSGTDVGLSNDFDGNKIPQWSGPDIGAYEYASAPPPSPFSASIIASPTKGNAPLTVDFTGSASGGTSPYSYAWNFGDGNTSSSQSPSHTYTDAGDFTAEFKVTDKAGREDSQSVAIQVNQAPSPLTASVSASPTSGEAPLAVSFTCSVSGGVSPYSYTWNIGDGASSESQNPSHTYSSAGDYTVELRVKDNTGTQASTTVSVKVIQAKAPLQATATASPASGQAPLTVNFAGEATGGISPYTYAWNFGDGNASTAQNPTHTYTEAKDFRVTFTVKDSEGSQDSATLTIQVTAAPQSLDVTATASPASGQAPLNVSFNASASGGTSPYSYTWNFGDGNTSTAQSPTHTYTSAGDFTAVLTVTDKEGQKDDASVAIKVTPAPDPLKATASASPTSGQAPLKASFAGNVTGGTTPYSYRWNFGDGKTSSDQNPSHTFTEAKDYTVTLTATDKNGQQDSSSVSIRVSAKPTPLKASFIASPTSGKAPLTVSFTGNSTGGKAPYSYKWDFDDGSSSTAQNPSHLYTEAKDFRVTFTVKDSEGSQDSATLTIQVTAAPQSLDVTATASPTSGQAPLNVSFSASVNGGTPPFMYTWNFGDGHTSNFQNPTHEFSSSGDFTVTLRVSDSGASAGDSSAQAVTSVMINVGDADKPADFDCVPRHLLFGISVSSGKVVKQSFNIIKSGSGKLDWTVADDAEWVTCLPSSGHDSGEVAVRVDSSSLSPGIYSSTISVSSPQAAQSPKYVIVKLKLTDDDKLPFGSFDTPVDGATVSGNIPLAGWALDDIELDRIEIKRNACSEDPPEAIDPDGLVLIGHAVFVKGARPDIETLYPDYPNSNLAGWGCMLPTFRLPQRGNGYFTIYTLAFDSSSQRALLGQKLIFADNGNRKKPFGSIETPEQGETVFGGPYIISGWALTPPPKEIPRDGSTIGVYVDGILAGYPVYNQGREDIARSFPEYRNSDGPLGSFDIDTSKFKNGKHLIEWYAEDSNGEGDVIDSRYFEIKNGKTDTSSFSVAIGNRYTEDTRGLLLIGIDGSPVFEVPEIGRIELQLNAKGGSKFLGWGEDMSRDLPIGSTLDSSTGAFVWSLGPGFIGEHILHFAAAEDWTISKPLKITVRILPKQEFWRRGGSDSPRGSQGRNSYSP